MDFAILYQNVASVFSKALNFRFVFAGYTFPLYICILFILAVGLVWYFISSFWGLPRISDPFAGLKGD